MVITQPSLPSAAAGLADPSNTYDEVTEKQLVLRNEFNRPEMARNICAQVGDYRLLHMIGEGGMGVVYEAEHIRMGRRVAIKFLRPELIGSPEMVTRMLNEARFVNRVKHLNIVDITDYIDGTSQAGGDTMVYVVMELLRGRNVAQLLERRGRLFQTEMFAIVDPLLDTLQCIHEHGIVHRDLKCGNVFLHQNLDGQVMVKLLDFGLVKQTMWLGNGDVTMSGATVGTPLYMAPEQFLSQPITPRTDIYALGIMMYQMLTGVMPFQGNEFGKLLAQHLRDAPPPFAAHNCTNCSPALERIVMQCLEKEPEKRIASAAELRLLLKSALGVVELPTLGSFQVITSPAAVPAVRQPWLQRAWDRCRQLLTK